MSSMATIWIIEAVDGNGRRFFFGPFVDEDDAENWGAFNLDFDLEDDGPTWESHEVTSPDDDGGSQ